MVLAAGFSSISGSKRSSTTPSLRLRLVCKLVSLVVNVIGGGPMMRVIASRGQRHVSGVVVARPCHLCGLSDWTGRSRGARQATSIFGQPVDSSSAWFQAIYRV